MSRPTAPLPCVAILQKLIKILEAAPDYGSVGLEIHLHNGRVVRISTSSSESVKPEEIQR